MSGDAYRFCPRCGRALSTRPIGGRERACCSAGDCGFVHWGNAVPLVSAIVEHEGGIVLVNDRDGLAQRRQVRR